MWSSLNLAYFDLRDVEMETIWNDRPGTFYDRTEGALRTVSGIAEGTIYRDDGWHFLQLGRFVERVQLIAALVDAHISLFPTAARHGEADWLSLLWICEAHFAYRRLYSLEHGSPRMVDFLVADRRWRTRSATGWRKSSRRWMPSPRARRFRSKRSVARAGWQPASTMTGPIGILTMTRPPVPCFKTSRVLSPP